MLLFCVVFSVSLSLSDLRVSQLLAYCLAGTGNSHLRGHGSDSSVLPATHEGQASGVGQETMGGAVILGLSARLMLFHVLFPGCCMAKVKREE